MDLKFQSSFIPKQPTVQPSGPRAPYVNLFSLGATIIFIIVIGMVGAIFIAEYFLNKSISIMDAQIVQAQSSFELSTIEDLKKDSARIKVVKDLLSQHVAFSRFLELLGQSTFSKVSYQDFSYERIGENTIGVSLFGLAEDFNALSLQSNLLKSVPGVNGSEFYDFKINENGVNFSVKFTLSPEVILYGNYVGGGLADDDQQDQ